MQPQDKSASVIYICTMKIINTTSNFEFYSPEYSELELNYAGNIKAGFPSPAEDFSHDKIDLNKLLIKHPDATFYAKVKGSSMTEDFNEGDLLIIDRSVEYSDNKIALCFIDGEFTLKRIKYQDDKCYLSPSNEDFPLIEVSINSNAQIWGIVTYSVKKH